MLLSEKERKIIDHINSGRLSTVNDFVEEFLTHTKVSALSSGANWASPGTSIPMVPDELKAMKQLVSFMGLCKKLENEGLIYIDRKNPSGSGPYIAVQNKESTNSRNHQESSWISRYRNDNNLSSLTIFPDIRLERFIKDGYKTTAELSKENEEAHRERALRLTRAVAIASITVSLLVAGVNIGVSWNAAASKKVVTVANMPESLCAVPK